SETWKNDVSSLGRNTIARGVLNCAEWQRRKVSDIREQIQSDNENRSEGERQRNVATRIDHFAGGESNVVPGVGGKERIRLGDANTNKQAERRDRGQTFADFLQIPAHRPQIAKVRCARARLQPDNNSENDERDKRASFCGCKNILHDLPDLQSARVHEREKRDEGEPNKLRSRKR